MPDEMDATLRKVFEAPGMAGRIIRPSSHQSHNAKAKFATHRKYLEPPEPTPVQFAAAAPVDGSRDNSAEQQPSNTPGTGSGNGAPTQTSSALSVTLPDETSCINLEGGQPSMTEDSPSNIINTWDSDLDFGTCITAAASDLQQIFGSSPDDVPGMPFDDQATSLAAPAFSDNDSTLFEEPANTSDIEGLIDEISERVGTLKIGPGGKTRFCGPTSTFNLTDLPLSEDHETQQRIRSYHIEADQTIPPDLEDHLVSLYFSWQDPSFHVVDRGIYEDAKIKWHNMEETPFYSEALRNAM